MPKTTKRNLFYKKESCRTKKEKVCRDIVCYGVTIFAADVLKTFYGEESASKNYKKYEVVVDDKNPKILVVKYNYKEKLYVLDENHNKKPVRIKHINTIIDKEWKVLSSCNKAKNGKKYPTYKIQNINTGEVVEITTRSASSP